MRAVDLTEILDKTPPDQWKDLAVMLGAVIKGMVDDGLLTKADLNRRIEKVVDQVEQIVSDREKT